MITDESIGLKLAENPDEAFWITTKEKCLKEIESLKHAIIINQAILDLADKKIDEAKKNGE